MNMNIQSQNQNQQKQLPHNQESSYSGQVSTSWSQNQNQIQYQDKGGSQNNYQDQLNSYYSMTQNKISYEQGSCTSMYAQNPSSTGLSYNSFQSNGSSSQNLIQKKDTYYISDNSNQFSGHSQNNNQDHIGLYHNVTQNQISNEESSYPHMNPQNHTQNSDNSYNFFLDNNGISSSFTDSQNTSSISHQAQNVSYNQYQDQKGFDLNTTQNIIHPEESSYPAIYGQSYNSFQNDSNQSQNIIQKKDNYYIDDNFNQDSGYSEKKYQNQININNQTTEYKIRNEQSDNPDMYPQNLSSTGQPYITFQKSNSSYSQNNIQQNDKYHIDDNFNQVSGYSNNNYQDYMKQNNQITEFKMRNEQSDNIDMYPQNSSSVGGQSNYFFQRNNSFSQSFMQNINTSSDSQNNFLEQIPDNYNTQDKIRNDQNDCSEFNSQNYNLAGNQIHNSFLINRQEYKSSDICTTQNKIRDDQNDILEKYSENSTSIVVQSCNFFQSNRCCSISNQIFNFDENITSHQKQENQIPSLASNSRKIKKKQDNIYKGIAEKICYAFKIVDKEFTENIKSEDLQKTKSREKFNPIKAFQTHLVNIFTLQIKLTKKEKLNEQYQRFQQLYEKFEMNQAFKNAMSIFINNDEQKFVNYIKKQLSQSKTKKPVYNVLTDPSVDRAVKNIYKKLQRKLKDEK